MTVPLAIPSCSHSLLGRLDPRWKLAVLVAAAWIIALLQTLSASAVALAGTLALAALAQLPPGWFLTRLGGLALFLIAFTVWLPFLVRDHGPTWQLGPVTVSWEGIRVGLVLCCKAVGIVTLILVVLATAPLNTTLHAAHALRVPGFLIQVGLLTYRYIFLFIAEFTRLRNAVRVRGYRSQPTMHSYRTISHVLGTLLVRSSERGQRVSQAMRCRGFDGRFRSLVEFETRPRDIILATVISGSFVALLVWDILQR
jgi:cobalt/nickel transport system permease protein